MVRAEIITDDNDNDAWDNAPTELIDESIENDLVTTQHNGHSHTVSKSNNKQHKPSVSFTTKIILCGLLLGGITPILMNLYDHTSTFYKLLFPSYISYNIKSAEDVYKIFKSGQPHIIVCINSTVGAPKLNTPKLWDMVTELSNDAAVMKHELNHQQITVGLLECDRTMYNNKSVFDTYKSIQRQPVLPTIFYTQPYRSPGTVPISLYGATKQIIQNVKSVNELKLYRVASNNELYTQCTKHNLCIVVLTTPEYKFHAAPQNNSILYQLIRVHRQLNKARFITYDVNKYNLNILRNGLPEPNYDVLEDWPRVIVLHKQSNNTGNTLVNNSSTGTNTTAIKVYRGQFTYDDVSEFIHDMIDNSNELKPVLVNKPIQLINKPLIDKKSKLSSRTGRSTPSNTNIDERLHRQAKRAAKRAERVAAGNHDMDYDDTRQTASYESVDDSYDDVDDIDEVELMDDDQQYEL